MNSPEKIEQLLKAYYRLQFKLFQELAPSYLEKRKSLLNSSFEFTSSNVENLIRVNNILSENSRKVSAQAKKLYLQLYSLQDEFTEDFEIEGTVRVSHNGNDSLIDFNPLHDEDEKSDRPHIMEIIDHVMEKTHPNSLFSCHYSKDNDEFSFPMFLADGEYWDYKFQTRPEFERVRFSWAFHNLVEHSLYALQDIVRINDFWNEVTVTYQNFSKIALTIY
ncbi:hypothetical protein LJC72_06245 [Bacteroides sp. OttesenSCG-928-D19]|nr:hypothetical protein [Bacteroides sp. OttesenSCG-928-D19]